MRVLSVCEYLIEGDRHPDHVTPYQIVRAVKGLPFDGHATITVGGVQQRIDSSNREPAVAWAVERLGARIFAEHEREAITIVPVPGHTHAMPEEVAAGRMHHLGSALAEALRARGVSAHVFPLLCWRAAIQSVREGGSRDPAVLVPQLWVAPAQHVRKVALIDDVVTSGGHIAAACAVLSAAGHDVADVAFTVGRTVKRKETCSGSSSRSARGR